MLAEELLEPAVEFILADFSAQGISMQPENLGGSGLIPPGLGECAQYEFLFQFADSLVEVNTLFNHLRHKRFQFISQNPLPRCAGSEPASTSALATTSRWTDIQPGIWL